MKDHTLNAKHLGFSFLLLAALSGCQSVYVAVDTRLASDNMLWSKLDGPRYVIRAEDEMMEASLAFESLSAMLERGLAQVRPDLRRAKLDKPADLSVSICIQIIDQGTGMIREPVYGYRYGHVYGPGGWGMYRSYGYVGDEVRSYHRGYMHVLSASAWVPDATGPAGRRVIWEGRADCITSARSEKITMPVLVAALVEFYGQATDRPTKIKLERDDPLVQAICGWPEPIATRPSS